MKQRYNRFIRQRYSLNCSFSFPLPKVTANTMNSYTLLHVIKSFHWKANFELKKALTDIFYSDIWLCYFDHVPKIHVSKFLIKYNVWSQKIRLSVIPVMSKLFHEALNSWHCTDKYRFFSIVQNTENLQSLQDNSKDNVKVTITE